MGCHKATPPPSIDGLSTALEKTAEQALPAPSLADEQIIVPARPGQADAQTAEILQLFADAGSTAVSSVNPQGRISILGDVPVVNVDALKAGLQHEKVPMQKGPASPTRLIEVLIEKPAPSPTP
jgi:hypothetical protein